MGRKAKYNTTLSDGKQIGYGFKAIKGFFRVQFPHPTQPGKYLEAATGYPVPPKWLLGNDVPAAAHTPAAKAILRAYSPTLPINPKTATWEVVMEELKKAKTYRERAWEVYTSILSVFRHTIPESKGPHDVTVAVAKRFDHLYQTAGYKRGHAEDAKVHQRSKKSIHNAIRRLSALWEKMKKKKYVKENVWDEIERPELEKTLPKSPSEDDVDHFYNWLEKKYPGWELLRLFVEVKSLVGCRLNDLCQIRSYQLDAPTNKLTINPDQDKTNRERKIPLPADLVKRLEAIKGPVYLWQQYTQDARTYRPGGRRSNAFTPTILYNAIKTIFQEFREAGGKLKSHDLRKRAITLMVLATENVELTAQAIGVHPATARKHYVDAKQAFSTDAMFKKMAEVLLPKERPTT